MPDVISHTAWHDLMCRIKEAPVEPGVPFGPCLLIDDKDEWLFGKWNGEGWFDAGTFEKVTPILWAVLPMAREVVRQTRPARP